jgi:hypothetical protein
MKSSIAHYEKTRFLQETWFLLIHIMLSFHLDTDSSARQKISADNRLSWLAGSDKIIENSVHHFFMKRAEIAERE